MRSWASEMAGAVVAKCKVMSNYADEGNWELYEYVARSVGELVWDVLEIHGDEAVEAFWEEVMSRRK